MLCRRLGEFQSYRSTCDRGEWAFDLVKLYLASAEKKSRAYVPSHTMATSMTCDVIVKIFT